MLIFKLKDLVSEVQNSAVWGNAGHRRVQDTGPVGVTVRPVLERQAVDGE